MTLPDGTERSAAPLAAAPETRLPRCPVCRARDMRKSERAARHHAAWRECGHCGLLADAAALASGRLPTLIDARLAGERFSLAPDDPFFVESYSARTLALSRGLVASPVNDEQRAALSNPYTECPAIADIHPLAASPAVPVSLVVICRPGDLSNLRDQLGPVASVLDDLCIVIDEPPTAGTIPPADWPETIRILQRPLAGDFAAQRNAGQEMARHDWVLQLDADETVGEETLAALGHVAALADAGGCLSVGLARRNRVDGVLSDLFPDIQYRLNRRVVRYAGKVHERPALAGGWRDSFIAPNLVIEHHLSRAHVERRSERYEALQPGKGRLFERDALLTPYAD
ncbi:hypothetical protein SI859A1_00553 [Aurantimonas manganoxydans SI85-9A1]|uniref:Glycosyl transferase n=1 Tax=Aurantimonas manganoxydans (strain ATCC BAA-1229 / DSM 21871 / SI85-9A1) TaxID=287752 RepID=Q1YKT9_AURMS|nr:hypothetical protein [Aurantimonas manganoxydans]EAS50434.1 hypothetical protein SI859A1_00553 [Aurantimonas manganoxydans SI85-9A1]